MANESVIVNGIRIAFPYSIKQHQPNDPPYQRPAWTHDRTTYSSGWYYENIEGDRFYFDSFAEAAEDFAVEIDFGKEEAAQVVAGSKSI